MKPAEPFVDLSSLRLALASLQRALVRWDASQGQDDATHALELLSRLDALGATDA